MLRFQPTETPSWDATVSTSHKLTQICTWTEQYYKLPAAAKDFVQDSYCRAAVAQCVLNANLLEETGLADLDSTQEVLQAATATLSGKPARETVTTRPKGYEFDVRTPIFSSYQAVSLQRRSNWGMPCKPLQLTMRVCQHVSLSTVSRPSLSPLISYVKCTAS